MVIEVMSLLNDDDDSDDPGGEGGSRISIHYFRKATDLPKGKKCGTLTIDALCG
jgi:hypothetical protein